VPVAWNGYEAIVEHRLLERSETFVVGHMRLAFFGVLRQLASTLNRWWVLLGQRPVHIIERLLMVRRTLGPYNAFVASH
jgi:hypothetical protein